MIKIHHSLTNIALLLIALSAYFPVLADTTDIKSAGSQPIVLMIGIDGLRADTLQRYNVANLQSIATAGVFAKMIPAMPTKTFTNFYSLATGLHPKHHGMISNTPYDRELKRRFNSLTDQSDPLWWQGEPIWITAEKQGLITATYFWLGSEVSFDGVRPTYWKPYDQNKDYAQRIEEVLRWLSLPVDKRPRLVTLYFSGVDTAAHQFGVGSAQEKEAVIKIDQHLGDLLSGLAEMGLRQQVNIIIVSDHGMINLSDDKVINLDPHVDLSALEVPNWSKNKNLVFAPFLNVHADKRQVDLLYQKLSGLHPNMRVLKRGAFGKNYHFDHPQREPDLMLLADPGWSIYASRNNTKPLPIKETGRDKATHGYDNQHPSMQAIFVGSGPAFKHDLVAKPFENIDLYSLLACILDIQPAKTDGNINNVSTFLTKTCA